MSDAGIYAAGADGEQLGPYTVEALCDAVLAGELATNVQVWWQGAAGWVPLDAEPSLAAHLDARRQALSTVPAASPVAPEPQPEAPPAAPAQAANDDELDAVFADLVRKSWDYHKQIEKATRVDEVVLGALITSTLDNGYALIDLTSDGTNHYTRFEEAASRSRITVALTHLTGSLIAAKVLGQRASVVIGYGEPVRDFQRIWSGLKAEVKSGYIGKAEPGTVTIDADVTAGYLYVQIDLYLDLADYLDEDLNVSYEPLTKHLGATLNALRKYLWARIYG